MNVNIINAHTLDILGFIGTFVSTFFTIFTWRVIQQDRSIFFDEHGKPRYRNTYVWYIALHVFALVPGINILMFLFLV